MRKQKSDRFQDKVFWIQVVATIVNALMVWFIAVQTTAIRDQASEMRSQTEEATQSRKVMIEQVAVMREQVDEMIESRSVMIEQLEQMRQQTMAIVETNRPELRFNAIRSEDFKFEAGSWTLHLNIANVGNRAAFDPKLTYRFSLPNGDTVGFTDDLQEIPRGATTVFPIQLQPDLVPSFGLHLRIAFYRREVLEEMLFLSPFFSQKSLQIEFNRSDSTWRAHITSKPQEGKIDE